MTEVKTFRTFIRIYSLFKSERLSASIKLTPLKPLIRSVMTYACPARGICGRHQSLKIAAPAKHGSTHYWKFSKLHIGPPFAHSFQPSVCIRLCNKIVQATSRSHTKIMRMNAFAAQDKTKPDKENIRDLNLAVVKLTTVLPLYRKIS
jgi:hypothetical protein